MRYVAFLDILGFKSKLKSCEHGEAVHFIKMFAATVYSEFKNLENSSNIKGYIVSDSLILYSADAKRESLIALMNLIKDICKALFRNDDILIRGGITRGDFDKVPASPIEELEKGLIVGKAYVEAFNLEGKAHVIGIIVSKKVKEDILKYKIQMDQLVKINESMMISSEDNSQIKDCYFFNYFDIDFLLEKDNLSKFIRLASKTKRLPHYVNTLKLVLKSENNDIKIKNFRFKLNDSNITANYSLNKNELDIFINSVLE